jgi:hypothetical protein
MLKIRRAIDRYRFRRTDPDYLNFQVSPHDRIDRGGGVRDMGVTGSGLICRPFVTPRDPRV